MAKYMKFNFSDCEDSFYPIVVRFEQDLTFEQLKEIDSAIQKKINEFIKEGVGWDCDGALVNEVLDQFDYKYEFVSYDYEVEIN